MKASASAMVLLITMGVFCPAQTFAQTPQLLDEFGASCKAIAMGQAFTAVADDFSTAYYNPAGLTQIRSPLEMTIGYFYAKPRAQARFLLTKDQGANIYEQPSSHGAIIGTASSLDFAGLIQAHPLFKPLSFGMVFWLNLPVMSQYQVGPEAYRPHFLRYEMGHTLMSMAISLAYEITPWLSIGAGIFPTQNACSKQTVFSAFNHSDYPDQFIEALLGFPLNLFTPDQVLGARVSIWQEAKWGVVPIVGVLLKPPVKSLRDKISLGVSWRGENNTHHARGPLIIRVGIETPEGAPVELAGIPVGVTFIDFFMLGYVGYQPAQATFALTARPVGGLVLSFDLTWKDYSKFVDHAGQRPVPPLEDIYVPRFGAEYAFNPQFSSRILSGISQIALRWGYFFEPTPVADLDKPHTHNIYDTDMDVISAGFSVDFNSRQGRLQHSLEAYFQVHRLRERQVTSHLGTQSTGEGIIPVSYFGPVTLSGQVWSLGASITTRF